MSMFGNHILNLIGNNSTHEKTRIYELSLLRLVQLVRFSQIFTNNSAILFLVKLKAIHWLSNIIGSQNLAFRMMHFVLTIIKVFHSKNLWKSSRSLPMMELLRLVTSLVNAGDFDWQFNWRITCCLKWIKHHGVILWQECSQEYIWTRFLFSHSSTLWIFSSK